MAVQEFDLTRNKIKNTQLQKVIAVMEDEEDLGMLTKTLREKRLPIAGSTKDGDKALELVRKHKTGVFFIDTDILTTEIEATLAKLKSGFPDLKVVIVSAIATKELVEIAAKNGAIGFLTKPLRKQSILKVTRHL